MSSRFLILLLAVLVYDVLEASDRGVIISIVVALVVLCIILTVLLWKIKSISKPFDILVKVIDFVSFLGVLAFFVYEFGYKDNATIPEPNATTTPTVTQGARAQINFSQTPTKETPTSTFTPTGILSTATLMPTPEPSNTPTFTPIPSNTPTPTITPTFTRLEIAVDAARKYYTALQNKEIDTAWGMLSDNFIKKRGETYENYKNYWTNKIKVVEIVSIVGLQKSPATYYIARTETRYYTKDDLWTDVWKIDLYFFRGDDGKLYLDASEWVK